jgi:dihydroxyacetone kinase
MEYGVGIHGEPGIKREKVVSADELAKRMVAALLKDLKITSRSKKEVCLLVNGFGATPLQELYLLNNSVRRELAKKNVTVYRTFVGNYMTSIDMAGASVSIMKLDRELKSYLNAKSDAPAFKVSGAAPVSEYVDVASSSEEAKPVSFVSETPEAYGKIENNKLSLNNMKYIVDKMAESIIKNEIPFCELDSHAGDGDFGMSVAKGFKQLKREWSDVTKGQTIGEFLLAASMVIMEYCGGASGPSWGSAFRAAGREAGNKTELSLADFASVMQAAVKGIQTTGERSFGRGAVVGDKTLIDALVPCADTLTACAKEGGCIIEAFSKGAAAAVAGAKETEKIAARMGRAGTVGERSIGWPDAGAHGLGVIFTDISKAIK